MDKRASPRYSVNLNALVHPSVGRSWLCEIQDFCDAGMLLVEQNGRPRRSLPGITAGQNVGIHFSVPGEKGDQHFRLEGSIVRVMDTGVGINFPDGMSDDAYAALSDLSGLEPVPEAPPPAKEAEPAESGETDTKKAAGESRRRGGKPQDASKPAAAAAAKKAGAEEGADKAASTAQPTEDSGASAFLTGGLKPDDAKRVVAMLRKEVVKIIPEMTASLFAYMDSELLELAKDAKSNAEQSEYFAAMSALEKAKKDVSQSILNDVLNQIDHPRDLQTLIAARKKANDERKAQAQERVKLSLVNTEEFEDWLAVANIVSRSERMYENFLSELLKRMGMLVDSWGHLEWVCWSIPGATWRRTHLVLQ